MSAVGPIRTNGARGPAAVPALPAGTRLEFDAVRSAWIMQAPERVLTLNETAAEVLRRVDGRHTIGEIAEELAGMFDAPKSEIAGDVADLLEDLGRDGWIAWRQR